MYSKFRSFPVVLWLEASVFGVILLFGDFAHLFRCLSSLLSLFSGDPSFLGNSLISFLIFISLFRVFIMSDQSDSQNAPSEVFMTESDPSSPLADNDTASDSSPVGRTRLLANIPLTAERERDLRSKFLNDPSTPEEHNLTLRYLSASQSGDNQTLRMLRHQILARRSRRHPPADAVPGLDVVPLREHTWLDSLANAGVRVLSDFYDRLQEFTTPNPHVVNLGDDSDSIATVMARDDNTEAVYQRRTGDSVPSKALVVGGSSHSGRQEEIVVGPGTDALWLPKDATTGPITLEIDGLWC